MKRLVLGVVGHVDHGKTALVQALTGTDTDRLPEEKQRGISIALGFAHADLGGQVDFIDAPGHERFVRTLVAGVTGADAVLLVVAANEGIKPQTREHLTIASLLGIREVVIAVTKADLVADADAWIVGEAATALAREMGLRATAPTVVSVHTGTGLARLRSLITELVTRMPPPPDNGFAYLPVDRAFILGGHGLVVTGTLRHGILRTDTSVELLPAGRATRIRGLQVHGTSVNEAAPGQRVAANIRGSELAQVPRGSVLATTGALAASTWVTVAITAAADAPPLWSGTNLNLLIGATEVQARLRLLGRETIDPATSGFAQLHTRVPIAAPNGDSFILRTPSPPATIAGGRILDPRTRRLKREDPSRLQQLAAFSGARGEARLRLILKDASGLGVALGRLALLAGLSREHVAAYAKSSDAVRLPGDVFVLRTALHGAKAQIVRTLEAKRESLPRNKLGELLPRFGAGVLDAAVADLITAQTVRFERGRLSIARPEQEQAVADAEAVLAQHFAAVLLEAGLSPPALGLDTSDLPTRRALQRLIKEGVVVRALDHVHKREVLFHRDAVAAAQRRLAPALEAPPGLLVGEVARVLGISRKFCVPLLEHLDAIKFTRRIGDRRLRDRGRA